MIASFMGMILGLCLFLQLFKREAPLLFHAPGVVLSPALIGFIAKIVAITVFYWYFFHL